MRIALILLLWFSLSYCASLDNFIPAPGIGQVIHHHAYVLNFVDQYKQPDWVCYMLCRARLEASDIPRSDDFRQDPAVASGSATPQDYSRSGFDRGHLAPSADFRWNHIAQSESFFMSNMSPQTPGFNRGIWKKLEERVRDWAHQLDTVYIVTGPILHAGLPAIGTNNVAVPEYYYKVILVYKPSVQEAIGFIMKNEGSTEPLSDFATSVDSVENITGIDFFSTLPDSEESAVESSVDLAFWELNAEPIVTGVSSKHSIASRPLPPGAKRMKLTRLPCSRDCPPQNRISAVCEDGTTSDNIGRGACAGHGGVKCWECRER